MNSGRKLWYIALMAILRLTVLPGPGVFAQTPEAIQKKNMNPLSWMTGEWEGVAVAQMGPGRQDTIQMYESLKFNLDSTIIQVEGIGYHIVNEIKQSGIYHHAIAVLSYDAAKMKYDWKAWRIPGGIYTEYSPEVNNNSFNWSMETPRGKMRYHIEFTVPDHWHETGEFSPAGNNWSPFFDMKLQKQHE